MTDHSLRPGDECQLCDLASGDKFGVGIGLYRLRKIDGAVADTECGIRFGVHQRVTYHGPVVEAAPASRILKGSELLVGDVVEYVKGDTGPGAEDVTAYNRAAPFTMLSPPEFTGANARCNRNNPWRCEPHETFRLLSRLDPKPEFPRQGTRRDLVPGMRYRVDHDAQECVCVAVIPFGGYYKYRASVASYEQVSSLALGGEITLLGIDPGFVDQTAETTFQDGKVVDVKARPVPDDTLTTGPELCPVCNKRDLNGYSAVRVATGVGSVSFDTDICGDCAGMRTPLKPKPQQKPRKLAPGVAYHLNDVGGDEGPGWSE